MTSVSSLRMALLCHGWYPDVGGVESHTRDLARELLRRGHEVHALCLDYTEGRAPYSTRDEDAEGVRVRRMAYRYHDHRVLHDLVANAEAERIVGKWLADVGPDVLHVQHATGFGLGVLRAASRAGVPQVMTLHDYWPLCPRGQMMRPDRGVCARAAAATCGPCLAHTWPHLMPSKGEGGDPAADATVAQRRTRFALECLALPARLLTPSAAARDVYLAAGVGADRIEVCENGVETTALAAEVAQHRAAARRGEDGVRLGVLGAVLPSKGTVELAKAFLEADVPGLTLEVHGQLPGYHGDESYVDELRDLAERDARITIHGPYDYAYLGEILAGLDGVAAPSRWAEVYGLTAGARDSWWRWTITRGGSRRCVASAPTPQPARGGPAPPRPCARRPR